MKQELKDQVVPIDQSNALTSLPTLIRAINWDGRMNKHGMLDEADLASKLQMHSYNAASAIWQTPSIQMSKSTISIPRGGDLVALPGIPNRGQAKELKHMIKATSIPHSEATIGYGPQQRLVEDVNCRIRIPLHLESHFEERDGSYVAKSPQNLSWIFSTCRNPNLVPCLVFSLLTLPRHRSLACQLAPTTGAPAHASIAKRYYSH